MRGILFYISTCLFMAGLISLIALECSQRKANLLEYIIACYLIACGISTAVLLSCFEARLRSEDIERVPLTAKSRETVSSADQSESASFAIDAATV